MYQEDIERFAFMYLCGERDKNILLGKEKMTFEDFERYDYITNALGFMNLNQELWNEYSIRFQEEYRILKSIWEEENEGKSIEEVEDMIDRQEMWIQDFCKNTPDDAAGQIDSYLQKEKIKEKIKKAL